MCCWFIQKPMHPPFLGKGFCSLLPMPAAKMDPCLSAAAAFRLENRGEHPMNLFSSSQSAIERIIPATVLAQEISYS